MTTPDKIVDASGLNCPLPILRTKKALADLTSGQILKLISTDPGSVKDMQSFCRQTGHKLLSENKVDGHFEILIEHR